MKNKTCIVLLPIENNSNKRKQLENFENYHFSNKEEAEENFIQIGCEDVEILSISDFMDLSNNEEFYPINYWIGYITIEETF